MQIRQKSLWIPCAPLLCFLSFCNLPGLIQTGGEKIVVHDAGELLEAIGSDRTIYLQPNLYDLSAAFKRGVPDRKHFSHNTDADQWHFNDLRNLRLIGAGPGSTRLVIEESYAHVLSFQRGENILIRGVELSHRPPSEEICLGAALGLSGTRRVRIEDTVLKGSGTFGLWLEDVQTLELKDSVITECTRGIVFASKSRDLLLRDSIFVNNIGGFNFESTRGVRLEDSRVLFNRADLSQDYTKHLFSLKKSGLVVLDTVIARNTAQGLLDTDRKKIRMEDTTLKLNEWVLK